MNELDKIRLRNIKLEENIEKTNNKLKETKYILKSITEKDTTCCSNDKILDAEWYQEERKELETFENIPKNLDNHYIDMKNCLYKFNNINDDDENYSILIGFIDYKNKKIYKI